MTLTKKAVLLIFAFAFIASVFICSNAQATQLSPWNVVADIYHNGRVFHYDLQQQMQPYVQNAANRGFYLGVSGKRALVEQLMGMGLSPQETCEYLLPNFTKILQFFRDVEVKKQDATVSFDRGGFHYTQGIDGVQIDLWTLFYQMTESGGKHISVSLPLLKDRAISVADLQKNTVKKATFTTSFSASGANRVHNVALATYSLDGITVGVGETFSFNKTVGKRTEQNGYKQAKVIQDGAYTDGVGGGVCQVSTTLYNALLLAEILPKACQHSLVSSYVLAGFDAMVSDSGADLTFVNDTDHPLYIQGKINKQNKTVTFVVYGQPNRYHVERESVETRTQFDTVEITDAVKYPELIYTDQTKIVTNGSDGVKSTSYLNYYDGGRLVLRKLIRQNTYKKVDRVIARGSLPRPPDQ